MICSHTVDKRLCSYSPHSSQAHGVLLLTLASSSCRAVLRCKISIGMAVGRWLGEGGAGPGGNNNNKAKDKNCT